MILYHPQWLKIHSEQRMSWGQRSESGTRRLSSCVVDSFERIRGENTYIIHNFTLEDVSSIISKTGNAVKSFITLYINQNHIVQSFDYSYAYIVKFMTSKRVCRHICFNIAYNFWTYFEISW